MSLNIEMQFDSSLRFSWAASDIKTAIESIAFLHGLPKVCPVCEAPIHFFHRSPQGNQYYGLVCEGAPAHEVNFGQHKEGGSLFYKGDGAWEIEYSARQGTGTGSGAPPAQPGTAAPTQTANAPAQSAPPAQAAKADITQLNMIGAVARMKKVADLDKVSKEMMSKPVNELTIEEAAAFLDFLKTL